MTNLADIVAIGGAHWDILGRSPQEMALYDDVPGKIERLIGGVAGPIAMKLAAHGADIALMGYAGSEALGESLMGKLAQYGVKTDAMTRGDLPTDIYMGIEGRNGMVAAIADCRSLEAVSEEIAERLLALDLGATHLIIDGNIAGATLERLARTLPQAKSLTLVPASPGKIDRFLPFAARGDVGLCVNLREANALCHHEYETAPQAAKALIAAGFARALVSNGAELACFACNAGEFTAKPPEIEVKRFTGAGDTLAAHFLLAHYRNDAPESALRYALEQTAAFISQESLDI